MHTVRQKWLVRNKAYSYLVQFIPGEQAEGLTVCMFRNHMDAYNFCAWLNGSSKPQLSLGGWADVESWNTPPKEEMEE